MLQLTTKEALKLWSCAFDQSPTVAVIMSNGNVLVVHYKFHQPLFHFQIYYYSSPPTPIHNQIVLIVLEYLVVWIDIVLAKIQWFTYPIFTSYPTRPPGDVMTYKIHNMHAIKNLQAYQHNWDNFDSVRVFGYLNWSNIGKDTMIYLSNTHFLPYTTTLWCYDP